MKRRWWLIELGPSGARVPPATFGTLAEVADEARRLLAEAPITQEDIVRARVSLFRGYGDA